MTVQLSTHTDLAGLTGLLHHADPAGNLFVFAFSGGADHWDVIGTIRVPLPDPPSPGLTARSVMATARKLTEPGWRAVKSVALAAYGPAHLADPMLDLLPELIVRATGLMTIDVLRVHGSRCWSYLCDEGDHRRGGPGMPVDPWSDTMIELATEQAKAEHRG